MIDNPGWWREVLSIPEGPRRVSAFTDALDLLLDEPHDLARLRAAISAGARDVRIRQSARYGEELIVMFDNDFSAEDRRDEVSFAPPLISARVPPWWDYYPPAMQNLYLRVSARIRRGDDAEVSDPSRVTYLASNRFGDDPDYYCAFNPAPDPSELILAANLNRSSLFLDIGQKTHDGWEVPDGHEFCGGPRKVDLMDTIDRYLVLDFKQYDHLPETDPNDLPNPPLIRARNPLVDWETHPYWRSEQILNPEGGGR